MEVLAAFLIMLAYLANTNPIRDIANDEIIVYPDIPGIHQTLKYSVRPYGSFKDSYIIKQQFDYSCGSAALATLLNYYLGERMTEQQVIQGLMDYGDTQLIEQRRAFSLLDMKQFVAVLGYQGAGFTAELDDLKSLDKPCIVPIEFYGYKHFVVYRGWYKDHLFFADPNIGNVSFTVTEFEKMWHGNYIFMVMSEDVKINALRLKDEDLRLAYYKFDLDYLGQEMRAQVLDNARKFNENLIVPTDKGANIGLQPRFLYKNVNIR